jgi:hypothetical protein
LLTAYINQVQSLLDDAGAVEYTTTNLTTFINDARVQIALSSESIRQPAQLVLTAGQQSYAFSAMTFVSAPTLPGGLGGVANVRGARLQLPNGGQRRLQTRAWEWFSMFYLAVPAPTTGPPTIFARLQPGILGTLWVAPNPDQAYTLGIDSVAYPIPLVDDTTAEALQYPWTEAVQYFAAYLALLSAQRHSDALKMWQLYQSFEARGTQITTPSRLPGNYPGAGGAAEAGMHMPITANRGTPGGR